MRRICTKYIQIMAYSLYTDLKFGSPFGAIDQSIRNPSMIVSLLCIIGAQKLDANHVLNIRAHLKIMYTH